MPYSNIISGIYIITCLSTNKHYIGKSTNCLHRLNQHKADLRNNRHHSFHLQRAYNKYGIDAFSFDILEDYPKEYLLSMENYWINLLDCTNRKHGYNISIPTGQESYNMAPETRKKIRNSRIGKVMSEETKQKLREINKGRKISKSALRELQAAGKVYRATEKYKNDMIKRRMRIGRKIVIYNYRTCFWKEFDTITDASNYLNSSNGHVHTCIDKSSRSVKGHLIFSKDNFNANVKYKKQKRINGRKRKKTKLE